jgi:hypothetical protein
MTLATNAIGFAFDVIGDKVRFGEDRGTGYVDNGGDCHWTIEREGFEFKLTFKPAKIAGLPKPVKSWPFETAPGDPPDATGWVTAFTGKAIVEGAFRYSVKVRRCGSTAIIAVDPMIIVGRV